MTASTATRRYARWQDAVGCAVAGLWPVALTFAILRDPSRYNPVAVFSGLRTPASGLPSFPTTSPNAYATQYAVGVRSGSLLVHGHVPWWNPYQGLGTPIVGGLFPLNPLLLVHDGALLFHLVLAAIAGVATYWLLREFRCSPLLAAIGGMLYATNGTLAWLADAAATPVCFLPVMVLGVERARNAAREQRGGGWRWLAVGTGLALLSGSVQTAALGLVLVGVVAVQRGWTLTRGQLGAYARKAVGGLAAGVAIAAPSLVALDSYLSSAYVAQHAGRAADHSLSGAYLAMSVAPYLFGRIGANAFPEIHALWSGVGGYAGFALLALGIASLFGRRDRGLRLVLAAWVGLSLADAVGMPVVRQVLAAIPLVQHIELFRYLPATWELALVLLAVFALRDLATASRSSAVISLTTGVLVAALVLLLGMSLAPQAVNASRSISATSMRQAELLVLAVAAALLLATLLPLRHRALGAGAVVVAEAAILFAIPLAAWPTSTVLDTAAVHVLSTQVGSARFFSLGAPLANFGSQIGVRQLDSVGLPVPRGFIRYAHALDPHANVTHFTGDRRAVPGAYTAAQELLRHLALYEQLGVTDVVAPTSAHLFTARPGAQLAYQDDAVQIWRLTATVPLVRAPGCGLRATSPDAFVATCPRPSTLLRTELSFPGWSASVNGAAVAVVDHGGLQAVALPKGRSVVVLTFLPPYVPVATAAGVLALLSLCVPWEAVAAWRRRRGPRFKGWAEDDAAGTLLPRRGAPDREVEPATGVVPAVLHEEDDDPSTSSIPAVTGTTQAVGGADDLDGPPTSAVALETAERPEVDDPPTISVPTHRPDPPPQGP
ncbi:MAG TPA: hypothetical protein VGZ03_09320 [Acidimicrobiales bacterium]|nr:hypothetical protein [Acidimicrobiales bacterium]